MLASSLIKVAYGERGTKESPAGSNRQKYGAEFHDNGVAWCAIFVSWCFKHAGDINLIGGFDDYTVSMAQWFYNRDQWISPSKTPQPGDVVFFHFGNPNAVVGGIKRWKGIHHVGIVIKALPDGRIMTIEGNTSAGNNANGGQVQVRYRSRDNIAGYGRPKYEKNKSRKVHPYNGKAVVRFGAKAHPRATAEDKFIVPKGAVVQVKAIYGPKKGGYRYFTYKGKSGWAADEWLAE